MPLIQILSRTTVSRGDEIKPDNTQTPQSKRRRPSYSNRLLGRNTRAPSIQDEFGTSGPQDGHHVFITDPVVAEGRDATERTTSMPGATKLTRTTSLPVQDLVVTKYPVIEKTLRRVKGAIVRSRIKDPVFREPADRIMPDLGEEWTQTICGPSEIVTHPQPGRYVPGDLLRRGIPLQRSLTPDVPRSPVASTIYDRESFVQGSRGIHDTDHSEESFEGHRLSFASVPVSHAHALKRVASLDNVIYVFVENNHREKADAASLTESRHMNRCSHRSRDSDCFVGEETKQARDDPALTTASQHTGQHVEFSGSLQFSRPPTSPSCSIATYELRSSRRSASSFTTPAPKSPEEETTESIVSWIDPPAHLWSRSSERSGLQAPIATHLPLWDDTKQHSSGLKAHESNTTPRVPSLPSQAVIPPPASPQRMSTLSDAPSLYSDTTISREIDACYSLAKEIPSIHSETSVYSQNIPLSSAFPRQDTPPLRITKSRPSRISVPSRSSITSVRTQEPGGSSALAYTFELCDEPGSAEPSLPDIPSSRRPDMNLGGPRSPTWIGAHEPELNDACRSFQESSLIVTISSTGMMSLPHSRQSSSTVQSITSSWVDLAMNDEFMCSDERPQSSPSLVIATKIASRSRQGSNSGESTAAPLCPSSPEIPPLTSSSLSRASSHRRRGSCSGSSKTPSQYPPPPLPINGPPSQVEYTRNAPTRRPSVSSPLSTSPFAAVSFHENSQRNMSTRPASARRLSISSASSRVGSPQVKDTHSNESGRRPSVSSISSSLLPKDEIMTSHIGGIHRDVCRSSLPANATPQAEGTRRDALFHQQSVSSSSSKSVLVHGRSLELSDRSQGHELGKSTAGPTSTPPPCSGGFIRDQEYHILPMPQQQGSESVVSTTDTRTRFSSRCSTNEQTQDSAKQLPFRRTSRPSHVPPTPAPCHSSTFEQEIKHQTPLASPLVPALSSVARAPSQTGTVAALLHAFETLSLPTAPQEKLPVPLVTQKPLRSSTFFVRAASHNPGSSSVTPSSSPKSTTCTISRSSPDSLTQETLHKDQATQTLDMTLRTSRTKQEAVPSHVPFPSQTLTRGRGDNLHAPEEFGPVAASSCSSKTSYKRLESAQSKQSASQRDASLPSYAIAREGEAKCSVASTDQFTTQSRSTTLSSCPPHITSPRFCQNFSSHQPSLSEIQVVSATTEDKSSSMEDVSWYKMKLDTEPICLRQLVGLELDEAMRLDKEREEREQAQKKGRDPRERRSKSRGKSSST